MRPPAPGALTIVDALRAAAAAILAAGPQPHEDRTMPQLGDYAIYRFAQRLQTQGRTVRSGSTPLPSRSTSPPGATCRAGRPSRSSRSSRPPPTPVRGQYEHPHERDRQGPGARELAAAAEYGALPLPVGHPPQPSTEQPVPDPSTMAAHRPAVDALVDLVGMFGHLPIAYVAMHTLADRPPVARHIRAMRQVGALHMATRAGGMSASPNGAPVLVRTEQPPRGAFSGGCRRPMGNEWGIDLAKRG